MTKRKQYTQSRIPEFKSREEEANWFDTHDMADYQDEFKVVKVKVNKNIAGSPWYKHLYDQFAPVHKEAARISEKEIDTAIKEAVGAVRRKRA